MGYNPNEWSSNHPLEVTLIIFGIVIGLACFVYTMKGSPVYDQDEDEEKVPEQQLVSVTTNDYPFVKSQHSLVAKYLTPAIWNKLKNHRTKTSGCSLSQCIACAVQFDNQHVGIYSGDENCYSDFRALFDPIIQDYHKVPANVRHKTDMDPSKVAVRILNDCPIKSTRIRVGRNIAGYGLSPGITRKQRQEVEMLMKLAFNQLPSDLQGTYYPMLGMSEEDRLDLVNKRYLFVSGDPNLQVGGMERDWPEGRGIFVSHDERFLVWVNEEDQLRIISMQKGGDINEVFERLCRGINAVESFLASRGKKFQTSEKYGYYTSCPTNLGTGMRASVMLDLPEWKREAMSQGFDTGKKYLQTHFDNNEMGLQARGSRGESGGETGCTYDLSNMYRLGYSEVELVTMMINGVNSVWKREQSY